MKKMNKMKRLVIPGILILTVILVGCGSAGIPQAEYDRVNAEIQDWQSRITELQGELQTEISKLKEQSEGVNAQLQASEAEVAELMAQISALKEEYELVGETPAETAEKIVKYYHDTHVYSTYDMFVCSDMSAEIWNMLKAQGINGMVVIGRIDATIGDILQSDHAWVLAEVSPGEYLALETTGGYVVPESENPLYYRGWSFDSPAAIKANNQLVREYNVRVSIIRDIQAEVQAVAQEHDKSTNQSTADKLLAVYEKLVEVRDKQDAELALIKSEIDALATELR